MSYRKHRECRFLLDKWAAETGAAHYAGLEAEHQAALTARLQKLLRTNTGTTLTFSAGDGATTQFNPAP